MMTKQGCEAMRSSQATKPLHLQCRCSLHRVRLAGLSGAALKAEAPVSTLVSEQTGQADFQDMTNVLNQLFGKTKGFQGDVEFWHGAERAGWLEKQGEFLPNWRRRWFVLKQGKIYWFKTDSVSPDSQPRGVIEVNRCLSIKGAEDVLNKPHAFEITTVDSNYFFIADTDKEKEDWINAVGRAIVRHSKSMLDHDQGDYTTT